MPESTTKTNLTEKQLTRLNSGKGLKALFSNPKPNVNKALAEVEYLKRLKELQVELIGLQVGV